MFEEAKGSFRQYAVAENQGGTVRGTFGVGRAYHIFTHGDNSHHGHHCKEIPLVVTNDR